MKNKKVFLPIQTFKNLVSEDTLCILQQLDTHKLSVNQLIEKTNLSRNQIKSQLQKLLDSKLIKEKHNHQLPQYSLTFKGSSLLHPENSRILVLFTASILTLLISIGSIIHWISQSAQTQNPPITLLQESDNVAKGPGRFVVTETTQNIHDPFYSIIAIIGIVLFIILISITYWRYKKNKSQAL